MRWVELQGKLARLEQLRSSWLDERRSLQWHLTTWEYDLAKKDTAVALLEKAIRLRDAHAKTLPVVGGKACEKWSEVGHNLQLEGMRMRMEGDTRREVGTVMGHRVVLVNPYKRAGQVPDWLRFQRAKT